MSEVEQRFAVDLQQLWYKEAAYSMIQATKPQTLTYGLNDSPVGLVAWIIEKFYAWSDSKGNIESRFTKDELLTNIMIYWVTETISSSVRMYFENARAYYTENDKVKIIEYDKTPTEVASFPGVIRIPREWAERKVNLKLFTEMPPGGHFAALEEPESFANSIRTFAQKELLV